MAETKDDTGLVDDTTGKPLPDAEIIARRSADIHTKAAKGHKHVKVFVLPPGPKPIEANGYDHAANKAATRQYAISQGMRPVGDVELDSVLQHANGISWALTYSVEVAVAEKITEPSEPDIVTQGKDAPTNTDKAGHSGDTTDEKGEPGQTAGAPANKGGEPNKPDVTEDAPVKAKPAAKSGSAKKTAAK